MTGSDRESTIEPLLLTPAQAARALGIGRSAVFEMLARGELPYVRLQKRRLVRRDAIFALIDRRTVVCKKAGRDAA